LVFLYTAAIIAVREPDLLTNPQFYAEGGTWYAEAYNLGWLRSLLMTEGGYFAFFPKLIEGLCLLVPLAQAAMVMNIAGILTQALPVPILLSSRSAGWGNFGKRLLLCAVYLLLPNSGEIHVVLTNAQWHLALAPCLLVLAAPPATRLGQVGDWIILVLCGLSGPFCLPLLPMAAVMWWKKRHRWYAITTGILLIASLLVGVALMQGGLKDRGLTPLGASPLLLAKLLAGHVFAGALLGQNNLTREGPLALLLVICLAGTLLLGWCALRANWEQRLFIFFSGVLLAGALRSPLTTGPWPQWEMLTTCQGCRYWFYPMLATGWALVWCATGPQHQPIFKWLAWTALAGMLCSGLKEWKYPPFEDHQFSASIRRLESAPVGTKVRIPITPDGWRIDLIKH
jgi:hypothetical protein